MQKGDPAHALRKYRSLMPVSEAEACYHAKPPRLQSHRICQSCLTQVCMVTSQSPTPSSSVPATVPSFTDYSEPSHALTFPTGRSFFHPVPIPHLGRLPAGPPCSGLSKHSHLFHPWPMKCALWRDPRHEAFSHMDQLVPVKGQ